MWRKNDAPPIDMYPWREEASYDADPPQISRPEPPAPSRAVQTGMPARPAARPDGRAAPAKAAQANGKLDGQLDGQLPLAPLVSLKQVGRFRAIARSNGWSEPEQVRLLSKFGFSRAEEITRDAYDRICTALENPVILTEVRAEIDEEVDFGIE
jgi:hypothetical protein